MNDFLNAMYAKDAVINDNDMVIPDPDSDGGKKIPTISEYYNSGMIGYSANSLKFWLMPFVCFMLFGVAPGTVGSIASILCRFVVPAFYILCGFFVLCPDRDQRRGKLGRAIKRSGLFFVILFVVYFGINLVYMSFSGADWTPEVFRLRTVFNFLVLDLWPFKLGESIWFIQSLFFAYIILWIADRLKILKIYKLLLILLFAFMLLSGEFAGVINFHILDYVCLPGGTVTRALPYLLLGMLIREHAEFFLGMKRKWIYLLIFAVGLGLAYLEIALLANFGVLVYTGHMIGYGIAGAAICCFALSMPHIGYKGFTALHGSSYAKRIYAFCQPVAFGLTFLAQALPVEMAYILVMYLGIFVYLICLLLAYLIGLFLFIIRRRPNAPLTDETEDEEYDDEEEDDEETEDAVGEA